MTQVKVLGRAALAAAVVAAAGLGLVAVLPADSAGQDAVMGKVTIKAQFTAATKSAPARLYITAEVEKGWHVFSVTQKKGGPVATKIKLPASKDYKLLESQFAVSPAPQIHEEPDIWPDLPLEEHEGKVTWYAPIEISPGVDPKTLKIEGKLNAQRCKAETCVPPKDFAFVAELGPGVKVEE